MIYPWIVLSLFLVLLLAFVIYSNRSSRKRMENTLDIITQQLEHLQKAFQRFVPHEVVEDIISKGVATQGEKRDVTILFADLVGFTAMSEKLEPEQVVAILNGYFQAITKEISRHNGYVSKFMGDGMLALFGVPEPNPWQSMDAAKSAIEMQKALDKYNEKLSAKNQPTLKLSIGIHRGDVIAGVVGSLDLVEYTVLGDNVNTASRIETMTRKFQSKILLSQNVKDALDDRFILSPKPALIVKGKSEPISTFELLEIRNVNGGKS